jgi:hypothetical protein
MTSIENGPAQAPNQKNLNNAPQVHPERVPSTLGGDTPVHPDFTPNPDVDSLKKRNKYIVGGAAFLSFLVVAGIGGKVYVEQGMKNIAENASGVTIDEEGVADAPGVNLDNNTVTVETPVPAIEYTQEELEAMSSESFASVDIVPRLDFYGPRIDEWRDAAYTGVLYDLLDSNERQIVNNNLPADKSQYTPQDILNAYAIDVADASSQNTGTPKDIQEGRKIQSVIMSPEHPGFERVIEKIGNGQGTIVSVNSVVREYPRLTNVTFRGHSIGDNGAELIRYKSLASGEEGYGLFTLLETPSGNTIWQFTDQYEGNDTSIGTDLAQAIK